MLEESGRLEKENRHKAVKLNNLSTLDDYLDHDFVSDVEEWSHITNEILIFDSTLTVYDDVNPEGYDNTRFLFETLYKTSNKDKLEDFNKMLSEKELKHIGGFYFYDATTIVCKMNKRRGKNILYPDLNELYEEHSIFDLSTYESSLDIISDISNIVYGFIDASELSDAVINMKDEEDE